MATVSYGASTAMTVTNLHSLASSATAGWGSAEVDNTSNLYFDAHVTVVLDPANTAPANSKAFLVYAYGGVDTGRYRFSGCSHVADRRCRISIDG